MKKNLAALAALFVMALSARATNFLGPFTVDTGGGFYFNVASTPPCGPGCPTCPWYTYFPYQAHFQTPAPMGGYPYWSPPAKGQTGDGQQNNAGKTESRLPPRNPVFVNPYQPVSYSPPAPSYWYGR